MKYRFLQKVKDAHRITIPGEKGAEIVPSVLLFQKGQVVEVGMGPEITQDRMDKLENYGLVERVD